MADTRRRILIGGCAALAAVASSAAMAGGVMSYADFRKLAQPPAPQTITYGPDALQHVELWRPQGTGPFPVVILLHGGCWQTSVAKADIMHRMAKALTERGVAVWSVEYRGVDVPGGGYPGTFTDVAKAADLLAARGPALDLDTHRVVALGHSAGGHLGLWLAGRDKIAKDSPLYAPDPQPLEGVVSIGGLPDLKEARTKAAGACGKDTVDRLVGPPTASHPDPFADTSPVSLLPLHVVQVLISGRADPVAPPRFANSYAAKARASGDAVTTSVIAGQGHFELITPGTDAGDAAVDAAVRLLGMHGGEAVNQ